MLRCLNSLSIALLLTATTAFADEAVNFKKVTPADLPVLTADGNLKALDQALTTQIAVCKKQNLAETRVIGTRTVSRQKWCVDSGRAMLKLVRTSKTPAELFAKAKSKFEWYQSVGKDGHGLMQFTGYNSPTLNGSLGKNGAFQYPIYRKPADLVQVTVNGKKVWKRKLADGSLVPYFTRKEIDLGGALANQGLEAVWVDDWFSVTILQVEGAGFVMVKDANGTTKKLHLNYAGQNGYPLTSPRKVLQAQGVDPEYLTIPGMRRYFKQHPQELEGVLMQNESYVFFDVGNEPPMGVDGIALTAWHSLAADLSIFPVGALTLIATEKPIPDPVHDVGGWAPFSRVALVQDTGGSITGPGRIDVYWGEDAYAELASGTMNQGGSIFVALLP